MNYQDYIKSELLVLIPVLYFIGMGLKKSNLADKWIPLVLGIVSIFMSAVWVFASSDVSGFQHSQRGQIYNGTENES